MVGVVAPEAVVRAVTPLVAGVAGIAVPIVIVLITPGPAADTMTGMTIRGGSGGVVVVGVLLVLLVPRCWANARDRERVAATC